MKKLLQKKYKHIFFSAHIDDVIFSCSGYISKLKKKEILIVTVFSDYNEKIYSRHAKLYLKSFNFNNAKEYFNLRKKEEKRVAKILNFDFKWLDFPEAIFRFKKKFAFYSFYYPKTSKLFGSVNKKDMEILPIIENEIKRILKIYSDNKSKLYFPLGIGNHVDHQILNRIGQSFSNKKIFFFEDFPYCAQVKNHKNNLKSKKIYLSDIDLKMKLKAITKYKSQIKQLFRNVKNLKKIFLSYYKKGYERYWYDSKGR